jgi:hypothetical protein
MSIKEKLQQIKYARLKPGERFLVRLYNDIEFFDESPLLIYKHAGITLFKYNSNDGNMWIHHELVWSILSGKYNLDSIQIKQLIKHFSKSYLKVDVITFHTTYNFPSSGSIGLPHFTSVYKNI